MRLRIVVELQRRRRFLQGQPAPGVSAPRVSGRGLGRGSGPALVLWAALRPRASGRHVTVDKVVIAILHRLGHVRRAAVQLYDVPFDG